MTLSEIRDQQKWRVTGSDISTEVINKARDGLYLMARIEGIPQNFLKKYCWKGTAEYDGYLLIDRNIRNQVNFFQHNLLHSPPDIGLFDIIFLRNVLIYFDSNTKVNVVSHLIKKLKPNGYFIIGHSDRFDARSLKIKPIGPSIYQSY